MATWSISQQKFIDEPTTGSTTGELSTDQLNVIRQQIGTQVLEKGGKLSDIESAIKLMQPIEMSDTEKNRKYKKEDAERIMSLMEDIYFKSPKGPLAYGQKGDMLRIGGRYEEFLASQNPDYNVDLLNYIMQLESIKPFFAKAAGDVGNFSRTEQQQAIKSMPTGKNSINEAVTFFNSNRKKLGLAPKDYATYLQESNITQTVKGDGTVIPIDFNEVSKVSQKTGAGKLETEEGGVNLQDLSAWQRLLGTEEESLKIPMPNLPYTAIGSTVGGFMKNPIVAGGIGGTGRALDVLKQQGVPLTKEQGEKSYGKMGVAEALSSLAGPIGTMVAGPKATKDVTRTGAATAGLSALLHPIQTLGNIRNVTLAGKTMPSTSNVIKYGKDFIENVARPEQKAMARKLLAEDIAKYGKKGVSTTKEYLGELTSRAEGSYSPKSGDLMQKASAGYNEAIWKGLRNLLKDVSPTAGKITTVMGKLKATPRNIQKVMKYLAPLGQVGAIMYGAKTIAGKNEY